MSVQDIIKKSVLRSENFTTQNAGKIVATLLFAIALGAFIYFVYQKFFTGVVYSRSFAMTLIGMSILTAMVTLAISSNVVISLGMVGARCLLCVTGQQLRILWICCISFGRLRRGLRLGLVCIYSL